MRFTAIYESVGGINSVPLEAESFTDAAALAVATESASEGLMQLVSIALTDFATNRPMPRKQNGFRDTEVPYDRKWPSTPLR